MNSLRKKITSGLLAISILIQSISPMISLVTHASTPPSTSGSTDLSVVMDGPNESINNAYLTYTIDARNL